MSDPDWFSAVTVDGAKLSPLPSALCAQAVISTSSDLLQMWSKVTFQYYCSTKCSFSSNHHWSMFYVSSWHALEIQPFCWVYCHGHIHGAAQFHTNLMWTWHSHCQAIGKQHLWMDSAAAQTVPGVPGQHRGTCLLSSRIHRGNSSRFHHGPLFYGLYSTSQEIRGRYYFLTKISVIWFQLAASAPSAPQKWALV